MRFCNTRNHFDFRNVEIVLYFAFNINATGKVGRQLFFLAYECQCTVLQLIRKGFCRHSSPRINCLHEKASSASASSPNVPVVPTYIVFNNQNKHQSTRIHATGHYTKKKSSKENYKQITGAAGDSCQNFSKMAVVFRAASPALH